MFDKKLVDSVVAIILRHTQPDRIWLFGSRITGDADERSDYDFALDDATDFDGMKLDKIRSEIEILPTLHKIDISNIHKAEARFANRVRDTGKVLFSANKGLRAEDGLLYFQRALARFRIVVEGADRMREEGNGDIVLDLTAQRFEFTYEMAWKALKRLLDYLGIDAKYPRAIFREAYLLRLIDDEAIWLDMIEMRNLSSHVYDESEIAVLLEKAATYYAAFEKLSACIQDELQKNKSNES